MSFFDLFMPKREWRRLRYSDAAQAALALDLFRRAGYSLELAWRTTNQEAVPALLVSAKKEVLKALGEMPGMYGLTFDPAEAPRLLRGGLFTPGAITELAGEGDAQITPQGMFVRAYKGAKRSRTGAAVALPDPSLGVHASPESPYHVAAPEMATWQVAEGGFSAPAGLVGESGAQMDFLLPTGERALLNGRPTIIIDGSQGQFATRLRQSPVVVDLIRQGRVQELSLPKAGQIGFNPLADTGLDREDALARWRWFWRGPGVYQTEYLEAAYDAGIRSVREAMKFWHDDPKMWIAEDAARKLLDAEQGVIGLWLSGGFDVLKHLDAGGHLLIDCPQQRTQDQYRFWALRGLIGLAMQSQARLITVGTRWARSDDPALAWLDTLYAGRRWHTTVFARCTPEQTEKVTAAYGDPHLAEYLRTLRNGEALANEEKNWWMVKAG